MAAATLTAIHVYPIKSCRGTPLHEVEITETGLAGDRQYQVVDLDGRPLTQRGHPMLACVQPTLTEQGLRLSADGVEPLAILRPETADTTVRSLAGVEVSAGDAGDAAAAWFEALLGVPSRLVAMTRESRHRVPLPGLELATSWADAAQALLVNTTSYDWIAARSSEPLRIDRFRPNLTVTAAEAWVEDTWRDVHVGEAEVGIGLAWPRCTIPQVDQRTGERHGEPARVLRAHRWCESAPGAPAGLRPFLEGNALFGIGCSIGPPGSTVRVGDEVTVRATGDPIVAAPG